MTAGAPALPSPVRSWETLWLRPAWLAEMDTSQVEGSAPHIPAEQSEGESFRRVLPGCFPFSISQGFNQHARFV